ncbi:MAG: molecular chaperone [Alteromonadaceae bacterium]|nr:molecular chaperone [Alteromonadaceae bacterium]
MIGFDYGTSNCAVAIMANNSPQILALGEHGRYIPSTLYSPSRDVIVNWLQQHLPTNNQVAFKQQRQLQLQKGTAALRELRLDGINSELSFGQQALNNYLEDPEEGYYIKSPKSFLGASNLMPQQIALFEDIVAAMMLNIKKLTEQNLQHDITKTVIGRPINFQGLKGDESNRQALAILTSAAKKIGFKEIEFQYEPVAAGLEFEQCLQQETKVLVVDIGGGTTDCSMLLMSPHYKTQLDRQAHLLAYSGQRVGGNDFDIQLALKGIMPSLGMNGFLKTGKPIPTNSYWQAVAINNINEQTEFYSAANARYLKELVNDAKNEHELQRLLKVQQEKLSYQLVNNAEQAKIALTEQFEQSIDLSYLESELSTQVDQNTLLNASSRELNAIAALMQSCVQQANCQPDVVFVTGGTAKSPVIAKFLQAQFPQTKLVVGDHFGSVTAGLARYAQLMFA